MSSSLLSSTATSTRAPSKTLRLMPSYTNLVEEEDLDESPVGDLGTLTASWRDQEDAVPWFPNVSEDDVTDTKWHQYKPPPALRRAPHITSQVLVDIISSSIENVGAQISESEQRRRQLEEEQQEQEDAARKLQKSKGKEPYLPIIITPEDRYAPSVKTQNDDDIIRRYSIISQSSFVSQASSTSTVVDANTHPKKHRKHALRKFFQRGHQKGESSAAGSAMEHFRKMYERNMSGVSLGATSAKAEPVEDLVECVSCLDEFSPKDMIKVPCHSYCHSCFVRLVSTSTQNEQQWPPTCCLNKIPVQTILDVIPPDLRKTFRDRSEEWEIPVANRVYCSHQDCSLWIKPADIVSNTHQGVCSGGHFTCTICRGPGHEGMECQSDPNMQLTNNLAEEEGWKRCFNCNALVEHREACQHMTCRCGTQFCYICGRRWQTCNCRIEQLQDIKMVAEIRREQRQFRRHSEYADLREILLQIEEFDREEALKAELLRQEQERLEEERRVHQEALRCKEIGLKYQELRKALDQLHDLQAVLLDLDQDEMSEELAVQAMTRKEELFKEQDAERSNFDTLMETKLREKEESLNKELQIRAAEEHDVEEAYYKELKEYWTGKKDGDRKIEEAMVSLRKQMDEGYQTWQQWKAKAIEKFEASLEENRVMKEEFMYSAKSRLDDQYVEKGKDLVKQKEGEKRWLEMVIAERNRLLDEWEAQEIEGDAESFLGPPPNLDETTCGDGFC